MSLDGYWARRRAALRAEQEAEIAASLADERALVERDAAERTDAEVLAELGLPDPDRLAAGDDFAAFLARAVPQHIQRRALRRLWRSNPVLACVDGLNDYDDDYLAASRNQPPLKTAYQVGRGMLAHIEERARVRALAEAEPDDESATPLETDCGTAPETPAMTPPVADRDVAVVDTHVAEDAEAQIVLDTPSAEQAEASAPAAPTPRRMRFRFPEDRA
ncbi:DUF3306 domain-containing protein [Sulfitobacter sp. LCG007]